MRFSLQKINHLSGSRAFSTKEVIPKILRPFSTDTKEVIKQIPLRPLPVIPRFYQSKPRLHAHWKLRPARKYKEIASFITLLKIDFDPADEGTSGCKELRRQATAPSAKAAFPKCVIECDERTDGKPAVITVKWSDGSTQIVQAANSTLLDILDSLYSKAQSLQRIEEDRDM
jgi:hypothetical protein